MERQTLTPIVHMLKHPAHGLVTMCELETPVGSSLLVTRFPGAVTCGTCKAEMQKSPNPSGHIITDLKLEEIDSEATRLLHVEGETSLVESAQNRLREIEELRFRVSKLRSALEYAGSHEHTESPCDETGSHFSEHCDFCKQVDSALQISTTDSVWLDPLRNTLGLLRACRSHLPQASQAGSLANSLDKEIERLENLVLPS